MTPTRRKHLTRPYLSTALMLAVALASGLATADAAVAPLADDERDRPRSPRDGAPPRQPDDGAPKPEKPGRGDAPRRQPDDAPRSPDAGPPQNPECVQIRTEARYVAYGYDHIVEIANTCEKPVRCTVMTDVNPERTSVDVAAGQTRSVRTFRGSPAREFTATVLCAEQDARAE